jgi:hypothetical protein
VSDRVAEHLVHRGVERLDLLLAEVGTLLERRQPGRPQELVHPRAADPGDGALVAQQRVEMARLVEQLRHLIDGRRGVRVRPERRDPLVVRDRLRREQLRPRPLLRAELAQPQLAAVLEPHQDPRGAVAERRAVVEQLQPAGRHQVHEQGHLTGLDGEHLADPAHPVQFPAGERVERRVERLERDEPGRERRFHARAGDAGRQAACGDLDLGQLGHASRLG